MNILHTWQHLPEKINPLLLQLGPIGIRWYGIMFVTAILTAYYVFMRRAMKEGFDYPAEVLEGFFTWIVVGLLIGARLGYVLFYNFSYFAAHPLEIFLPFNFQNGLQFTGISGLSYHGAFIGGFLAAVWFCKRGGYSFLRFLDFLVPAVALGYTFGRIGNFLNGELFGRVTELPWGMYFPNAFDNMLRHPSQLYEAFFEGIFIFIVLWTIRRYKVFEGFHFCMYILLYGTVRFFIEYTREPDVQLGLFFGLFSMGQILCIIMIFAAFLLMGVKFYRDT